MSTVAADLPTARDKASAMVIFMTESATVIHQLRLPLQQEARLRAVDFVVSRSNHEAAQTLADWPQEPGSILALYGPAGSGKSHLAAAWVERTGALALHGSEAGLVDPLELEGRALMLDQADEADEEALFHLFNLTQSGGGSLLMVSREPPAAWHCAVPDLRSRLNAVRTLSMFVPDDIVLSAMLKRAFASRNIIPGDGVVDYLTKRIDRTPESIDRIVDKLDAYHRPVTRVLARQVLEGFVETYE